MDGRMDRSADGSRRTLAAVFKPALEAFFFFVIVGSPPRVASGSFRSRLDAPLVFWFRTARERSIDQSMHGERGLMRGGGRAVESGKRQGQKEERGWMDGWMEGGCFVIVDGDL